MKLIARLVAYAWLMIMLILLPLFANAQDQLQEQLARLQQASSGSRSNHVVIPNNSIDLPAVNTSTSTPASNQTVAQQQAAQTLELQQEAFSQSAANALPFTPSQVRHLKALFDETQKAASMNPGVPPRPTAVLEDVNLNPGATPPFVRLAAGFISSIIFVDATGAPWPIQAYDIGNPRAFNVQWDKQGNTLLVQSITAHQTGNLAVLLKGLDTPIVITLLPGQHAVDYRAELRLPMLGPNARPDFSGLPPGANPLLLDVLNNIRPSGTQSVNVQGCGINCKAWMSKQRLFLLTSNHMTVLSPGWLSSMSNSSGANAYELPITPVVLVSRGGQPMRLYIQQPIN